MAEANRTLAQARSAVASAKTKTAVVSSLLPMCPSSRQGKGKGKVKSKSKDSSCLICGRSDHFLETVSLNNIRKDLAKDVKMHLARFYLGATWSFDSELFETVVLQAECCPGLWCDRNKLVESRQCRFLVDAVKQDFFGFSCRSGLSGQTMVSVLLMVHWRRASLKSPGC